MGQDVGGYKLAEEIELQLGLVPNLKLEPLPLLDKGPWLSW